MLIQAPSQANKQPLELKKFRVSVGMRHQQKKHTQFHKHQKMCLLITYPSSVNNTNLAINIADPNEFITHASQTKWLYGFFYFRLRDPAHQMTNVNIFENAHTKVVIII